MRFPILPARGAHSASAAALAAAAIAAAGCGDSTGPERDATAPTLVVASPANGATLLDPAFDLALTAADDRALARVGYALNGAPADSASVAGTAASHTFRVQGLREGANTIAVVAVDAAGNASAAATLAVTYAPDRTAPALVVPAAAAGVATSADTLRIAGQASDAVGVRVVRWRVNGGARDSVVVAGAAGAAADFALTARGLADGANTVEVEALDAARNADTVTVAVVRDRVAPRFDAVTPAGGAVVLADSLVVRGTVVDTLSGLATLTARANAGTAAAVTPDAAGAFAVTLRGLPEGETTVTLRATDLAGNVTEHPLVVTVRAPLAACTPPAGFAKAWAGTTDDWFTPENWSPAGVPTAADDVFVCAGDRRAPVVRFVAETAAAVRALRVDGGTSLELETPLAVHGSLDARGPVTGAAVEMHGRDVTARGRVAALTIVGGIAALDSLVVEREIDGWAAPGQPVPRLGVGAARVRVGGSLSLTFGLVMTDPAGVLDVRGGFHGIANGGLPVPAAAYQDSVTAGTLHVGGTFSADRSVLFAPRGAHRVVFDGAAAQFVAIQDDHDAPVLHDVEVRNAAGVTFTTTHRVGGQLTVVGDGVLAQDSTRQTIYDTRLPVTTAVGYRVARTVVGPAVALAGDQTVQLPVGGRLVVGCGSCDGGSRLRIGAHHLTVEGDVESWFGYTVMTDPAGVFEVRGDVTFSGAYSADSLLAGTMRLTGDFRTAFGTWGQYVYRPSAAHTLVLDGATLQTVSFAWPAFSHQQLPSVEVRNAAGVRLDTTTYVGGQLRMVGDGRLFMKNAGDALRLVATGADRSFVPSTAPGTPFAITTAGFEVANVEVAGHWVVNAGRPFYLPAGGRITLGVPTLGPADFRVADGVRLVVYGDLRAEHGQIYMASDASGLSVLGDVTIGDAFGADSMIAGTLAVGGDFTQVAGPNWGYQPSGTHVTLFNGDAPQTVTMASTDFGTRRFNNMRVAIGSDVRLATSARVLGHLDVFGALRVAPAQNVGVEHAIYARSGATIENQGNLFCNHVFTAGTGASITGNPVNCNGGQGTLRVRLSWSNAAANLDAHLVGPAVDGSTGLFTVSPAQQSYEHDGKLFASFSLPFTDFVAGPEIIEAYTTAGRYRVEVKAAPGSAVPLGASGATVVLESYLDLGDRIRVTPIGTFTIPAGFAGTTWTAAVLENRTIVTP